MHIKNFLYAAPHRELPAFLALNGGKVKKKVGKDEICKWICSWFSDFVWQTFIYKIAECIGQNAAEPDGEAHRPGKCNQADIFPYTAGNQGSGGFRFHKERHRAGVLVGNAGTDEAGANRVDLNVIRQKVKPQGFAVSLDTGFGCAVRRAGRQAVIAGNGSGYGNDFIFAGAFFVNFYGRGNRIDDAHDVYVESVENIFGRFFQRSDSGVGKNKVEWCGLFSFVYPSFYSRAVGNVQYPGVDFCRSGFFTYFFNSLQALLVTSADENIFGFRLFGIVKSQRFADS